jgi:hypothetical protein
MPQELTDVDAFTSPVRAPLDGDDADSPSITQGLQPLADRTFNLKNRLDALPATVNTWTAEQIFQAGLQLGVPPASLPNEATYTTPVMRTRFLPIASGVASPASDAAYDLTDGYGRWWSSAANATVVIPLRLPSYCWLHEVRVWVIAGTAPGTVSLELWKSTPDPGTGHINRLSYGPVATTMNPSGLQTLAWSGTQDLGVDNIWEAWIKFSAAFQTFEALSVTYEETFATGHV